MRIRIIVSAIALFTPTIAQAQIPDGHYVVSAYNHPLMPGSGGVYVVGPRATGAPQQITGLGPDLTGALSTGTGSYSVAVRQSDGALFVGEMAAGPAELDLHVITLNSLSVASDMRITIANIPAASGGEIDHIEPLPTGDLLIAVTVPPQPPLNGSPLGVVSLTAQTVTPIPIAPVPPGIVNAMTTDPSGSTVYFATFVPSPPSNAKVYSVSIAGGVPEEIAEVTFINEMVFHRDGKIYLCTTPISCLDPVTKQLTVVGATPVSPTGLAIERATDDLVFPLSGFGAQGRAVYRMTLGGESVKIATLPSGVPSAIAVRHDPWTYGVDTPALSSYRWRTEPNPGGLPRIGNAQFGLHLDATPSGNASGVLLAGSAPGSTQVAGVELLLGGTIIFAGNVPASGDLPLPLPFAPALVGITLYLQSFHLDPGGLASSNGLRMTVLQ